MAGRVALIAVIDWLDFGIGRGFLWDSCRSIMRSQRIVVVMRCDLFRWSFVGGGFMREMNGR